MNFANGSYEGGFNQNGMYGRGILKTTDGTIYAANDPVAYYTRGLKHEQIVKMI